MTVFVLVILFIGVAILVYVAFNSLARLIMWPPFYVGLIIVAVIWAMTPEGHAFFHSLSVAPSPGK